MVVDVRTVGSTLGRSFDNHRVIRKEEEKLSIVVKQRAKRKKTGSPAVLFLKDIFNQELKNK